MKAERKISWEGRLFRYISLLLIVAVLFSGVTLARYASTSGGNTTTGIARFAPTYSISGVNSVTYSNSGYWQEYNGQWLEQGKGSARTVRIGMHNEGDVAAVPAVIHMEGPAEFWENVALQLTTAKSDGSADMTLTTQYVLADLLRVRDGGKTVNGETHNYTYGEYINWDEQTNKTFSTGSSSPDESPVTDGIANYSDAFDQRGSEEEVLTMSGGIDFTQETSVVTAVRQTGSSDYKMPLTIRITASMKKEEYSVGFQRRQGGEGLPAFYLDCRKTVPYYSVDIILPETVQTERADSPSDITGNPFYLPEADGSTPAGYNARDLILFLTWTNSVSGGDFGTWVYQTAQEGSNTTLTWGGLSALAELSEGETASALTFNGADVIGYHYNHNGVTTTTGGSTTVRIDRDFEISDAAVTGSTVTGSTVTYSHVASIRENEGQYPHDMELVEDPEGNYYKCTGGNPVTISEADITALDTGVNVDEFLANLAADTETRYYLATEKGYSLSFSVTFLQASELPENGTNAP